MSVNYQPSGKQFTGKHMLLVLFAFFGTIIAVNLVLSWFAVGTWSGLVAKNGYVASRDFKKHEIANAKQTSLGWATKLEYSSSGISVKIHDKTGAPVNDLNLVADIRRPTTEKFDMPLVLTPVASGEYRINTKIAPGQWMLNLRATGKEGQRYAKTFRFTIKPDR